jgi:hypothetical protein
LPFAENTSVPVSKTKGEIDNLLRRRGATGFGFFEEKTQAIIVFEMKDRRIRFNLPLPDKDADKFKYDGRKKLRSPDKRYEAWEQVCRSRWRALFLCIKAKMESVESNIESFDDAFLSHIQMPDGHSVGELVRPRIVDAYLTKTMQPLLSPPKGDVP